jgi:hypothetical protein
MVGWRGQAVMRSRPTAGAGSRAALAHRNGRFIAWPGGGGSRETPYEGKEIFMSTTTLIIIIVLILILGGGWGFTRRR